MAEKVIEEAEAHTLPEGAVPLLPPSTGLTEARALELLEQYGRNELPEKKTPGWVIFVRCLWGPMPIALWIAVIIEFSLQNWPDGGILLCIQFGNATIGWYETTKAGDAVEALKSSLKPLATVYRDGVWKNIDAAVVVPGDMVKLAAGSAVPADSSVNEGQIDVDEAALTGESLPVTMTDGDMAKMGSTVVRGEVDGTVQFTGQHTFFGKTALLLQSVEADLGNIHYILVKIMYGLTGLSFILCMTAFFYLMFSVKINFKESLEFAVVLLVVSIPIAIEIVVTTTLALGSKELSKEKVIVTRLTSIEMMSAVNMLCSDKTGTLTLNKMEIQQHCPTYAQDATRESVLVLAALAAKWREPPRDALDTMVLGAANLDACDAYTQLEYKPFDPRTKRTEATLKDSDGNEFKVTKGAPNIVLGLCHNKDEIEASVNKVIHDLGSRGIRCLAVARTLADGNWYMSGILTFLDPPRPDTKITIARSKQYGVDVKMITGDHQLIAKEMARMLDMDTNILTSEGLPQFPASGDPKDIPKNLGETHGDHMLACGGFAHVYPEHKYLIVETLRQRGFVCAMTGDGVNDAPALKRADVGVAVHGATDAARAASDMVLTEPGLSVVVEAMLIARGVFQRMQSFLTYRVSATLQLVTFFFLAVFILPPNHFDSGKFAPITNFTHAPATLVPTTHAPPTIVPMTPLPTTTHVPITSPPPTPKPTAVPPTSAPTSPPTPAPPTPAPHFMMAQALAVHLMATDAPTTLAPVVTGYEKLKFSQLYFHLPVLMFMLITLLNDGTLMCIGYDRVFPAPRPQKWNLPSLFFISTVLAAIACVSSLVLLYMALDSHRPDSAFKKVGLPAVDYGKVITMLYLKTSISDFLTLFAARTQWLPFFGYGPSRILLGGGVFALGLSTILATFWPEGTADDIPVRGLGYGDDAGDKLLPLFTWLYCIVWWFVQDAFKVGGFKLMERYDWFSYRSMLDPEVAMRMREAHSPEEQARVRRGSGIGSLHEPLIKQNSGLGVNSTKKDYGTKH